MADNIQLNPGVSGAVVRTFADAGGVEWQATVPAYATTLADGANVLQVVTPSNGLPVTLTSGQTIIVSQGTAANLNATAVIAAGTALIGKVSTADDVTDIYDGTTSLTFKRAFATATASGNTQVVAAVTSKSIKVLRYSIRANTAVSGTFRSNSTAISASFYLTQFAVNNGSYCKYGHYQTASGEALNFNLAATGTVAIEVLYVEV